MNGTTDARGAPSPAGVANLRAYFAKNGILLCNENRFLPSLETVGGDWNSIVRLIELGEVFHSKLYRNRVAYLSREFYYQMKPYRQRLGAVSEKAREVYAFIESAGLVGGADIKNVLMLPGKAYGERMDELCSELLVTAVCRERTMNESWSSFLWGTYLRWEETAGAPALPQCEAAARAMLALLSEKDIGNILS